MNKETNFKTIQKNKIRAHFYLPVIFCVLAGCYGNRQIAIDESLETHSERMTATIRGGGLSLGRASFGRFHTVDYAKLDSPKFKSGSGRFYLFPAFRYETVSRKRKVFTLTVSNNMDTASLLLFLWIKSSYSQPGFLSIDKSESMSNSLNAEGEIKINADTVPVKFSLSSFGNAWAISESTTGYIIYKEDTTAITYARESGNGKPGWGYVTGIRLNNKERQVAALQLVGQNYVWIWNELPFKMQMAIAAFFSVVLGAKDM